MELLLYFERVGVLSLDNDEMMGRQLVEFKK